MKNISSLPSRRQREKRKRIFLFSFFIIFLGGIFLYPKIEAYFYRWQEERRLNEFRERFPMVSDETIISTPMPFSHAPSTFVPQGGTTADKWRVTTETFRENFDAISPEEIPAEKILAVPYICQNPFRDQQGWEFHKNSCEEAALLQVYLYATGETATVEEADRIFRDMVEWQKRPENFGDHIDLYGEDMKKFIEGYYDLPPDHVVHLKDLDRETVQKVITLGYPLIVPTRGDLLKNPFYPYPGYHMLTIIGYTEDQVITNDVGTKRGEKYPYPWDRFLSANQAVGNDAFVLVGIEEQEALS